MQEFLDQARWTTPPVRSGRDGGKFVVEAAGGSDFWQETLYGFHRDSGHALLTPASSAGSLEVTFKASCDQLYDQAGLMIRTDQSNWIKTGIEITDGMLHVGAVVTRGQSDWSLSPVPERAQSDVTIRASWSENATTIRARTGKEPWRTIRVAPFEFTPSTSVGLYVASPERTGLTVSFSRASFGPADDSLHSQPAEHDQRSST
jgi:uncharacterized protein